MFIYFFLLLLPLALALAHPKKSQKNYPGFWLYFPLLLIFCGFRYNVGADWGGYQYIYDTYYFADIRDVLAYPEPGFFLLNKLSEMAGLGLSGVLLISSFVFLFGCFTYARTTANPWLAIAAIIPYLVFIISMSGVRQAIAIGLGFYLFADWTKSSLLKKFLIIALAISFHNSSAILFLFFVVTLPGGKYLKLALASACLVFVSIGLKKVDSFDKYSNVYVSANLVSQGAFVHVLLVAFPALLYILYRKKIAAVHETNSNLFLASILTLGLLPFLIVSSTGVDRLTLYFSFLQMSVYPALIKAGVADRLLLKGVFTILILGIFFVYFLFGTHASLYVPYQNILFN